ncbi:SagB family peptide dehydrogenase [Streptomyces sp. Amel2xC10]|uniref:SagB family peptide dehydrogenase n=1 Tax=Streptomyces sp. Amel2xC10 TaxID=1305826 RepID=UPI000A08A68A|nr:SagB family peptide dehydrogenase [Streptomyces sp. Amel2xC10]SMF78957.1 SagB-type dehydrogenase domain-containing protein [Streptomyces sp. Amel2xC10]
MSLEDSQEAVSAYLARQGHLATAGAFGQQHTSVSVYSPSTVVRAPEAVVRGRWSPVVGGFVGEELLLNHRRSGRDLGMQLGVSRYYGHDAVTSSAHSDLRERQDRAIDLPEPRRLKGGLTSTVTARRSGRQFSGRPSSLEELATVLWHAQGVTDSLPVPTAQDPDAGVPLRTVASGGGLYPVRLVVLAQHVKGLAAGAYEYQPHSHTLYPLQRTPEPVDLAGHLWTADVEVDKVAFALVHVYDLYVNSQKYGDSGLVFALIEVGGMSQNIHLARTALGMIACDQGGYDKQKLEKSLGYDGTSRHVVHFTLVGHGEV